MIEPEIVKDEELEYLIKDVYDFNFISAAAWLLPINTLKMIGGFDPIFFHYGEDENYCQRIKYHNYLRSIPLLANW